MARTVSVKDRMRHELLETTKGLRRAGILTASDMNKITLRLVDRSKLKRLPPLRGVDVQRIRAKTGLSQAVFAGVLNTGISTVSQWERDEKKPRGAALRLLYVVRDKGLEAIL
jgi:putative transcriptional regulator